jgi:hypothetical protein
VAGGTGSTLGWGDLRAMMNNDRWGDDMRRMAGEW